MRLALVPALLLLAPPLAGERAEVAPRLRSRFGRQLSAQWALGERWTRRNLAPVANPHPSPEPQPRRAHPFDAAVSPDGRTVFVGLLGSELEPGGELAVYDVVRATVAGRIPLTAPDGSGPPGSGPYRLIWHPDGRHLVVTNRFSNFASVVDARARKVVAEIPLDFYAQGGAFSRDGRRFYAAIRYSDQVLVAEIGAQPFTARLLELGGMDYAAFARPGGIGLLLARRCGKCHSSPEEGFYAGPDARRAFDAAMAQLVPGAPEDSRLLRAGTRTRDGGYADRSPPASAHPGGVVFAEPGTDPDYRALRDWIAAGSAGPGIPVGNPRSKPKILKLSGDGRRLFVGNTGTQDISIVDLDAGREVGAIYLQNVVNDLAVYRSPRTGRELLFATTLGAGFGVAKERDPYGGESWDPENPAAQFTLRRDTATARPLPRERQRALGPFDATDGTAGFKFRDAQNDLLVVDLGSLAIPKTPPERLEYLLKADRYEAHRGWVRYTSDTAESTAGDIKGDIPPELMRVAGALPEKLALSGDRLFVTMQGSNQVQEWRVDAEAVEPGDTLVPAAVYATGWQPVGIAAGPAGTPAEGLLFTANFLGGSLSVIDRRTGASRELLLDPALSARPLPDTDAERGEMFAHTAVFSSDGDSSCVHCHYFDMGDGRPWGVSQVMGQEYLRPGGKESRIVIGGAMGVPQMRGLFGIQPFFYEGVLSVYEPRSMIMEHAPAEDFGAPAPSGDFTALAAHRSLSGMADLQSGTDASPELVADLEARRDALFQTLSTRHFGKAYTLRDFQRFVGEWQAHEPRLLPNPFDAAQDSARRGERLFNDPRVGCSACHPPPHFAKKDFRDNPTQSMPALTAVSSRDSAFTLVSMNRLDAIDGVRRDLEPGDRGRVEEREGHYTTFSLRGLWDRPPVFLHGGLARSVRETVATPGHAALGGFKYPVLLGGVAERPGRREVGLNATWLLTKPSPRAQAHREAGSRIGLDTHGGTSHLGARELEDLMAFLETIE